MTKPVLSICIPTYNRVEYLKKALDSIVRSDVFLNTDDVEIVISNNCSKDSSNELCSEYAEKFPNKIKYIYQQEPIIADINIFKTIEYANGTFCKLNNDTCAYADGALDEIVKYLKNNPDENAVFFFNQKTTDNYISKCDSFDDFIKKVSYQCTWIGSFCVRKSVYDSFEDPIRCLKLQLSQVDLYGRLFESGYKVNVLEKDFFVLNLTGNKGGNYNIAQVFGKNYFDVLSSYVDKPFGIKQSTIEEEKKKIIKFINNTYFDYNQAYNFNQTGYYEYMKKHFGKNLYFYVYFVKAKLKLFRKGVKRKIKSLIGIKA